MLHAGHPLSTFTQFKGYCRDDSNDKQVISYIYALDANKCHGTCKDTVSCVALTFETSPIKLQKQYSNCYLYQGGPYTNGTGTNGMTCYVMPKGISIQIS